MAVPRGSWNHHAASKEHCTRLERRRRLWGALALEHQYKLLHPHLPPDQMQRMRDWPQYLLKLTQASKAGLDLHVVEVAQRWVIECAGIKESNAHELQRALLASFADLVAVKDQDFHRTAASFTKLVAGVALASVSHALTYLLQGRSKIAEVHYSFCGISYENLYYDLKQTAIIAALAQLAPHATKLHVEILAFGLEIDFNSTMLWLAACRLLFPKLSQLPFRPQRLVFNSEGLNHALDRKLVACLAAETRLHTLLDSIDVYTERLAQEEERSDAASPSMWTENACKAIDNVRTTILLGVYRSKTSLLWLLPRVVVPMILEHIKPCSLSVRELEETETDDEEEMEYLEYCRQLDWERSAIMEKVAVANIEI